MRSGPSNSQHNILTKAQLEEQQQALLFRELGLNWSLLQGNNSRGSFQQQQNDFVKHFSKPQQPQSSFSNIQHQRELTPKRPSLIHDFASNMPQNSRYSLIQPHLRQAQAQSSGIGISPSSDASYLSEDEENWKRLLAEKLEKIDREKSQSAAMQKNAEKKAKACEKLLAKASQEPSFISAMDNEDNDDNYENRNGQSDTDALINRIYAENRRKAAAANPLPPLNPSENNRQLMKEDAIRLKEEYERGLQLLPDLIKTMRIQREKRQDILEQKRIIYDELLNTWEKKVIVHEKNKKKLVRDGKHREIFEKTFVELRKMREEKERSNRGVERIRFSLSHGGISNVAPLTSSNLTISGTPQIGEEKMEIDQEDRPEFCDNRQAEVDEKVFSSCVVPPVYSNRPRRFFDNKNGIVENALSDSRSQLEAFQVAWSDTEKAVFLEKISVYGKNFAAIAAFLPLKSVKDCVYFYYMTKKRNNYKTKFGRRRKKLGRQGYRPPIMPRFGDTNENLENYGRGCTFVECLLCDSRILVLESLTQRQSHQFEEFLTSSHVDSTNLGNDLFEKYQEMPICTKCQTQAQRNRTLNRCPLGSCVCVAGKRKMKPSRNIPEKFGTLNADQKRFLINKLKMPPTSNKCCTNCFKRIVKDIEDLLLGEFKPEFDAFKKHSTIREETGFEEEEELIEHKVGVDGLGINKIWPLEEQPPFKELKLDEEVELDEESKSLLKLKNEIADQKDLSVKQRPPLGSITKGTPNRSRSLLIETSLAQPQPIIIEDDNTAKQKTIQDLLNQFAIASSNNDSIAVSELNIQISKLLETFPIELLFNNNNFQIPQQQQHFEENKFTTENIKETNINNNKPNELSSINLQQIQTTKKEVTNNIDILKRKSGLANVLLPSPSVTTSESTTSTNPREGLIRGISNSFSSSTTTRPLLNEERVNSPIVTIPIIEKPPLKQRTSNLTISDIPEKSKTESGQDHLSSCYESLSDDSNDEEEKQIQKQKENIEAKIGVEVYENSASISTPKIQQSLPITTNDKCKASSSSTPLPTFLSLFDLMDEGNEKEEEEYLIPKTSSSDFSLPKQISNLPSSSSICHQTSSQQTQKQQLPQQQPTISNFFQIIQTTKISENNKNINDGKEEGTRTEECFYEPLSSDEET